jgi:hypothetical protein
VKQAAFTLFAALLYGQAPAPPGASIEGTIFDAVGGVPLPNVVVSTAARNGSDIRTDAQGHYAFRGLAGGFYQIYVRGGGYAPRSAFVRVLSGQETKGVDLKLDREAVLAGRILDSEKNAVTHARVSLRGEAYRDGRPALNIYKTESTNDLGEFRFTGISAGRYYLQAEPRVLTVLKLLKEGPGEERAPVVGNVRTYYGNSVNFESAAALDFTAGRQMEGLDIMLLREKTVCLTGSLAGSGVPGERYLVQLSERIPSGQSVVASGNVAAGDNFEICDVPAGTYRLSAFTTNDLRYAAQTVTVTDRPVAVPPLILSPGVKLSGTITVENAKPEEAVTTRLHVAIDPKDRIRVNGEMTEAAVDASGAFAIPSALPDEYWLRVTGLPLGYYIKQATVNGQEVLRNPLRAGQGELAIVLASDGPTLSGTVNTAQNQPIANAVVVLAVSPLPDALGWGDIRVAFADQNGFFSFPSEPPGNYRLLAFPSLPDGGWTDPGLVRSNLSKATELTLAPKEKKTVTITAQ